MHINDCKIGCPTLTPIVLQCLVTVLWPFPGISWPFLIPWIALGVWHSRCFSWLSWCLMTILQCLAIILQHVLTISWQLSAISLGTINNRVLGVYSLLFWVHFMIISEWVFTPCLAVYISKIHFSLFMLLHVCLKVYLFISDSVGAILFT